MTANEINALVDRLREQRNLSDAEFKTILETDAYDAALQKAADEVRRTHYGTDVYVRGLIEFTNYCKNNCYYCGIRRDNRNVTRYRLTKEEILSCCAEGYDLGFRTFVLQGGEDLRDRRGHPCAAPGLRHYAFHRRKEPRKLPEVF